MGTLHLGFAVASQDEVIPALVVPDGLKPRGLGVPVAELMFDAPLPPNYPLQPAAPPYDKPQHGTDWTGLKPFHVGLPLPLNSIMFAT